MSNYADPDKRRAYTRAWNKQDRARNPERYKDIARRQHAKKRAIIEAGKDRPCADCGGKFPICAMDYDHRLGETKDCTIGSPSNRGINRIIAEIAKCDVVCANCHRIRTEKRGYRGADK